MSARAALLVSLLALVALPAAAAAKRVEKAQLCGAARCYTFDRANARGELGFFEDGNAVAGAPTESAPWYRLKVTIGAEGDEEMQPFTLRNVYIPSLDRIGVRGEGGDYDWFDVVEDLAPVLRDASARLKPLPAADLPGVETVPPAPAPAPARQPQPRPSDASPADTTWIWIVAVAGGAIALLLLAARRVRRPGPLAG